MIYVSDKAKEKVSDAKSAITSKAEDVADKVKDKAADAKEKVEETAEKVADKVNAKADDIKTTFASNTKAADHSTGKAHPKPMSTPKHGHNPNGRS